MFGRENIGKLSLDTEGHHGKTKDWQTRLGELISNHQNLYHKSFHCQRFLLYDTIENRQKFTVEKVRGSLKQRTLNTLNFSIEYIEIHSYPLRANIF